MEYLKIVTDKDLTDTARVLVIYLRNLKKRFSTTQATKDLGWGIKRLRSALSLVKENKKYVEYYDRALILPLDDKVVEKAIAEKPLNKKVEKKPKSKSKPKYKSKKIVKKDNGEPTKTMIDAKEVALYLRDHLMKSMSKAKQPNSNSLKTWASAIEMAIRLDGHTKEELKSVIDWIHTGDGYFWIANIRSGAKLREKFPQLWHDMYKKTKATPNIKQRILDVFGSGNPFLTSKMQNGDRITLCLYGDNNDLYDYNRNHYLSPEKADKAWKYIGDNIEKIITKEQNA